MEWVRTSPMPHLVVHPAEGNRENAPWPILCFLHGYDEAAPTPLHQAVTRHGPLHAATPLTRDRFIVVAPQLPTGGDLWHRYAKEVVAIIVDIQQHQGGDPRRTYLTGFSFGGNGVFDLALSHPSMWAALWPVDPTRVPISAPIQPIWLSLGQVSRHYRERFIQRLALESAEQHGEGTRLWLDEGADHVGTARRAYADKRIYHWLLKHST